MIQNNFLKPDLYFRNGFKKSRSIWNQDFEKEVESKKSLHLSKKEMKILDFFHEKNMTDEFINNYFKKFPNSQKLANIRGTAFRNIVINALNEISNIISIETEVSYLDYNFEKFDIVVETKWGKICIYCQIELWGGGHQANRGSKYIVDPKYRTICEERGDKFLCVCWNDVGKFTCASKLNNLLKIGFDNKILCYPSQLYHIIDEWVHQKEKMSI